MPSRSITEFQLIRRLQHITAIPRRLASSIVTGIGDDAAVVRTRPGYVLLATTDLLAEHVHFDLRYMTYRQVGVRAAVANLSDIAAMGGRPRYALIALALSSRTTAPEVEALYTGIQAVCHQSDTTVIGGDTSTSHDGLFLSLTILGEAKPEEILRRSGARPGDVIYVTGTLGDSHAGWEVLQSRRARRARFRGSRYRRLISRHIAPTARVLEARRLAEAALPSSAIDLSDGLAGDLRHICEESKVGALLDLRRLPLSSSLLAYARERRADPIGYAVTGGEDYELLFTVPPTKTQVVDALIRRGDLCATSIGTITKRRDGLRTISAQGRIKLLRARSYEHRFAAQNGRQR